MDSPAPATQLGRYQLLELLGRGGMAEVFKARLSGALGINRTVAVKRMLPEALKNPEFVELFIREARVCSRMMHPNLIQILELGQTDTELFLAMELVEGPDLRKVLTANQQLGKSVPMEFAICIALGVLRGLDAAHRLTDDAGQPLGVVHRDLSPANVLLSYEGAIKVADFGVAHSDENRPMHAEAGKVKGKLQYMAPEQILGTALDARVDVFGAGAVLYEMVTGSALYPWTDTADVVKRVAAARFKPVLEAAPGLDPQLGAVLAQALAASPDERFASCDAFAAELVRLVHQGRIPAAPESELALYLQVLTPRQAYKAELGYTPMRQEATPGARPPSKGVAAAQPQAHLKPASSSNPAVRTAPSQPQPILKPISSANPAARSAAAEPPANAFAPGSRPPQRPPSTPQPQVAPVIVGARPVTKEVAPPPAPPPAPPSARVASPPPAKAKPPPPPTARPASGGTPAAARPTPRAAPPPVRPPRPLTGGDLARPPPPPPTRPDSAEERLNALLVDYLTGDDANPAPEPAPSPKKPKGSR